MPRSSLAALGQSGSCPHLSLPVLSSGPGCPGKEERPWLSLQSTPSPSCAVCSREPWASPAQLLGSSSEQSGLRRARWFVPSGCSFLCRPLKCSKPQKAGSLSSRQGPERMGLTLEQEREMKSTQKFRFWGVPGALGYVPGQPVTGTHEIQACCPGSAGRTAEDIDSG